MTYEKIIKDSRGKIRISVCLITDRYFILDKVNNRNWRYDVSVWHILPKKRTEYINSTIATDAEILEAKMELHNLIKPQ